jgi:protoporphyrinogen oxidase
MNIAVIGGGITGLTAAYELLKRGHTVTLFERGRELGGLAGGFKQKNWNWSLEYSYHHLFTNDYAILGLIKELGLTDKLILKRPITANYYKGTTYQLDSAIHLLKFPYLSIIDKLRTGALIAFMKVNPFWQPLENTTAEHLFCSLGGKAGWQVIWEPLMTGKFGHLDHTIAASWLWARIKKRTPRLYYIEGGFATLIEALAKTVRQLNGIIRTGVEVSSTNTLLKTFDRVLLTTPTPVAKKLAPALETTPVPHLHAQTLILETDKPILTDVYWLSITDRSFPFLAAVAHTNMIDKKHYGNHHITYFGNYLPEGHKYLKMTKDQLLKEFLPYIKRLNPSFHLSDLHICHLFIGHDAQPVHQLNYSKKAPALKTNIPGVYLANLDSIYPWDRGTNYAVELGKKAARILLSESVKKPF